MAPVPKPNSFSSPSTASEAAIAGLAFLAADAERLDRFLALSGLGPHNLRRAAADPAFLTAVLDYIVGDERLLVAFAAEQKLRPAEIVRARDALGGPPPVDS